MRTVDNHLSRIYDKVGVRSRTELADALAPTVLGTASSTPPSTTPPAGARRWWPSSMASTTGSWPTRPYGTGSPPERLPSLKDAQVLWFGAVLQGEEKTGDLRAISAHLDITDDEIAVVIGHLAAVLGDIGLDRRLQRGIVSLISRLWYARDF